MLTLSFIVYLVLFISLTVLEEMHGYAMVSNIMLFCTAFGSGIFVDCIIDDVIKLVNMKDIDCMISKYSYANQQIETRMKNIMRYYTNCSFDVISKISGEEIVAFANSFPELRSLTSVQSLIESWWNNQRTLERLKEIKMQVTACKWRLYFGG